MLANTCPCSLQWKVRTIENRHLRLQQAFLRWRQFTKEAQKYVYIVIVCEHFNSTDMIIAL